MAYEKKDGDFSLFRNKKKEPESRQPDMTGTALIDGINYRISAWVKGEGESKCLTGRIEVEAKRQEQPTPEPISDDLPF